MTVAVTRRELSADDVRREAVRCRDARVSRRMLALALVLEGSSREAAAPAAGVDRQSLRDWVHRYNGGVSPVCATGLARGESRASGRGRRRSWKRWWRGAPTRSGTGSCAGGGSICQR